MYQYRISNCWAGNKYLWKQELWEYFVPVGMKKSWVKKRIIGDSTNNCCFSRWWSSHFLPNDPSEEPLTTTEIVDSVWKGHMSLKEWRTLTWNVIINGKWKMENGSNVKQNDEVEIKATRGSAPQTREFLKLYRGARGRSPGQGAVLVKKEKVWGSWFQTSRQATNQIVREGENNGYNSKTNPCYPRWHPPWKRKTGWTIVPMNWQNWQVRWRSGTDVHEKLPSWIEWNRQAGLNWSKLP